MNDSTQNTTHPIGRHGISSSFLLVMRSCVCVGVPWWNSFHSRILPTASIDNQQFDIVSTTYYVRVPHITTIHQYRYNKAPNSSFWWQVRRGIGIVYRSLFVTLRRNHCFGTLITAVLGILKRTDPHLARAFLLHSRVRRMCTFRFKNSASY